MRWRKKDPFNWYPAVQTSVVLQHPADVVNQHADAKVLPLPDALTWDALAATAAMADVTPAVLAADAMLLTTADAIAWSADASATVT
jgi:hypothetical protein